MNPLDAIPSYVGLGDSLATAGQPSEEQLAAVAAAGFRMVINLGLHDDPSYALADERACVTSLGMRYVHIPVPFANPTLDALMAFSTAMQEAEGDKVFVHCRHNKRVPVFVALDRIRRQGWERTAALGAMRKIWTPDATWQAFIERTLAE
jgi:uncharacterized protein (TIGR01244 family)